jgi:hypothetical protein
MPKTKGKIPLIKLRAVQPFKLSDESWRTVETAYSQSISPEIRTQIANVTTRFLQLAIAERTGSMNDAVERIRRLRDRALSLNDAIKERPIDDAIREYVDDELAQTYALLNYDEPLPARNYVGRLSLELGRFVNACNEVLNFAPKYDYWPDGGAWEVWIRQLTGILDAHGLQTGARKDATKNKADKASSFVEFVYSFQKLLPNQYVRGQHSKGALATSIAKARRGSKALVGRRKARARSPGRKTPQA